MNKDIPRISFSELKIWNDCPYKHKLIYKEKLSAFAGNAHTTFGTAMHAVCENKIVNNESNGVQIFSEKFEEELQTLRDKDIDLDDSLIQEMRKQGPFMIDSILPAVNEYFGEYEVLSVEEPLLEQMQDVTSYGKKFKGFIDLVLKTKDGRIHIVDWKTCSWGWNAKKRSDPMVNYQLIYYKNYYCLKHGIDPDNVETHFALLKRTAKANNVEIFRVTSGKRRTENSLKLLSKALTNIEKGPFIKNRLSCRYCEFYKTESCT